MIKMKRSKRSLLCEEERKIVRLVYNISDDVRTVITTVGSIERVNMKAFIDREGFVLHRVALTGGVLVESAYYRDTQQTLDR